MTITLAILLPVMLACLAAVVYRTRSFVVAVTLFAVLAGTLAAGSILWTTALLYSTLAGGPVV